MSDELRIRRDAPPGIEGRIGGMRQPGEVQKPEPRRRLRDKIPTLEQLKALIVNGKLILPARYFRGYFLDMLV